MNVIFPAPPHGPAVSADAFADAEFERGKGALWGGRSCDRVFIGRNGAESYCAARGFRAWLKV